MIRRAVAEDMEALAAIVAGSATAPQWSVEDFRVMLTSGADGPLRRVVLVAEEAGGVSGFAVYTLLVPVFPPEAELESLAVGPERRRRGVGAALLNAVIDAVRAGGAVSLVLEVRASNTAAKVLYRVAGFQAAGVRKGYYAGPAEDAVIMQLAIGGESTESDKGADGGSAGGR